MTLDRTFFGDDYSKLLTTYRPDGAVKDITGATLEALAMKDDMRIPGTATMVDAPAGQFRIAWGDGDLSVGIWTLQARVTLGSVTQTVSSESISVEISAWS